MRFKEFRIINEAAEGLYTIGDSHAVAVATAGGQGWTNLAIGGKSSTDAGMLANIAKVPKGATVLVSQGANDTANAMRASMETKKTPKDPKAIAANVANVVSKVEAQGANVIFMLFPNGPGRGAGLAQYYGGDYQEAVREAIKSVISVPIIDINGKPLTDGVHATMAVYKDVANQVRAKAGAGVKLGPAGQAPGAPASKNKPDAGAGTKPATAQSATLTIGPPFETTDDAAVKAMQQSLEDLGYSVGSTGVDGKYGPRTAAAVAAFKKDYKLTGDGNSVDVAVNKMIDDVKTGKVPKVAAPTQVAKVTGALPPLSTDAVTQGKVGEVLNFIARFESRGDYNIILGGDRPKLTSMTIAQVYNLQSQMLRQGKESSAVGRYQYIGTSLKEMVKILGLDIETTKFDEKTQDAIAIADLRRRAGLDNWLSGSLSNDRFLENLSRIWAGLPSPSKGGASFYSGVGSNAAGTGLQAALGTLQNINAGTAVA
jgi:conjugal transfer mating pair stabilization protein TraG